MVSNTLDVSTGQVHRVTGPYSSRYFNTARLMSPYLETNADPEEAISDQEVHVQSGRSRLPPKHSRVATRWIIEVRLGTNCRMGPFDIRRLTETQYIILFIYMYGKNCPES